MLTDLIKLAYKLDKKGEYDLANDVAEVIKELSQRAGVNPEEIVTLADYFDTEGEITEPKQVSQPKQVSPYTPYYPTSLDQDAVKWVLEFIDKHLEEEMKAKNRDRRAKIWALLYDSYINDRVLSEQNEEFILRLLL